MCKFAKYFLIAAGMLLFVYLLAILGLNIYLQSEGLQKRIVAAAGAAAGCPVRIQGTHYTPWSGFSVTGISLQGASMPGQPPLVEAASVSFRFAFLSLFQGKLVVSDVLIMDPSVESLRAAPAPASTPGSTPPISLPVETVEKVERPPVTAEITVPQPPAVSPPPRMEVEVKQVRVVNGKARFLDSNGALISSLGSVEVTGEILPDRSVSGTFRISETSAGNVAHPSHVKGTFTWRSGKLVIPRFQADWAGGKLTGSVEVGPEKEISITAAADGILVKKLAGDAGLSAEGSRGSLFSKGNLHGFAGRPETFTGKVDVSLKEARFQPLDFIRQIGELLNIQELQMLELKTAEATFSIHDKKVNADTVVLESENLVMDAKGPIGFDGKIKLQARLLLNEQLRKDLSGLLANNFKDSERPGYQQIPFSVTGTVSRPKTDLLDKLTGFRLGQDVGGLLKNLFKAPPPKPKTEATKEPGEN